MICRGLSLVDFATLASFATSVDATRWIVDIGGSAGIKR